MRDNCPACVQGCFKEWVLLPDMPGTGIENIDFLSTFTHEAYTGNTDICLDEFIQSLNGELFTNVSPEFLLIAFRTVEFTIGKRKFTNLQIK